MITREHAHEMIDIFNSYFQLSPAALRWRKMRGGRYHSLHRAIALGPMGDEATVVHEFAHHLDRMTNKRRYSKSQQDSLWSGSRGRQGRHDVPFRAALVKVATAWYGDAAKYPWSSEYQAVQKWYTERRQGNAE